MIKPASNNQLKTWKKLLMGKYRKKMGLFLAEGVRCVEQILENKKVEVEELIVQKGWNIDQLQSSSSVQVYELEQSDFQSVSDTDSPQGVIAVCKIPPETDFKYLAQKDGIIIATDGIQDPGNLGTIIRTACWFDAAGILFGTGTVDSFHPKVVRSTAGATGILPYLNGNVEEFFQRLETEGWTTFLLDAGEGSRNISEINTPQKSILVIGNEGNGISNELLNSRRNQVKIEGNPNQVESLNASIACSIAMYLFSK